MAKDSLIRSAAAAGVLIGGAAIEVAASASFLSSLIDWVVGAGLVAVALRDGTRRVDWIGLLTAVLWYLATLVATPGGWWHGLDGLLVLGYRGPLLHQLVRPTLAARQQGVVLVAIAYASIFLVTDREGLATAAAAAVLAALVGLAASRGGPTDLRRADTQTVVVLCVLCAVWAAASLGWVTGTVALVISDGAVLVATWHLLRRKGAGWLTEAVAGMVVELGQSGRPSAPLSASLAGVLADPDLRIATHQAEAGWRDEFGNPIPSPLIKQQAGQVTMVPIPGGGTLALLHGPEGGGDSDLSQSAATAAALLLESVRLTAEARRQADDVRNSGARLVTIDQQERQALAQRLRTGPQRALAHVRTLLEQTEPGAAPIEPILERLDQLSGDLDRLAHGLHPHAVANGSLPDALRLVTADAALPTSLILEGSFDSVAENTKALIYFFTSECMTNIARHANATEASVRVTVSPTLRIEIMDNGHGGATTTAGRGLQGLADRITVNGGTFMIDSPPGGPTLIVAELADTVERPADPNSPCSLQ